MLIDAVLSSKFITVEKSKVLIEKLKKTTSDGNAKKLSRLNFVNDRYKSDNEEIFINIDSIDRAIDENKKISFKYYDYTLDKSKSCRREGKSYIVSPYGIGWVNDSYYLIGNCDDYDNLSHFKIERIIRIEVLDELRKPVKEVSDYKNGFNISDYINKSLYMFSGDRTKVEIKFENSMINTVLEKFGKSIPIVKIGDKHFKIIAEVIPDGLIYWLLQYGQFCEVLSPPSLRDKFKGILEDILDKYK